MPRTFQTDNQDVNTTILVLDGNGEEVEVNVFDLLDNALENAGFPKGIGNLLKIYFNEAQEHEDLDTMASLSIEDRIRDIVTYIDSVD